ncbi:hypothetical protein BDQ12DRAFT_683455 [Crucibulum laeve]|uniref:Uncharacterized protein n=1 Tax=Crucibulum laeve TaxID=68775 RepID=A0A5C3M023_9AGAR|nr:hypothetical protein BDQ12DRAFT_683455 [Crucibulum laeve]
MYAENVMGSSTAGLPVIQPTREQMLCYFQAFLSVKDSAYVHTVQRTLSAFQSIVQLRLSSLVCTIAPFLY